MIAGECFLAQRDPLACKETVAPTPAVMKPQMKAAVDFSRVTAAVVHAKVYD